MLFAKVQAYRLAAGLLLFLAMTVSPASAGTPSDCSDLDAIAPQSGVDFESRIRPIFSSCTACHGEGGAAGLDLRPGQAFSALVGVQSTTNPPQSRVQPFEPDQSLLVAAINCAVTGGPSFQMPGTDLQQRALIRDWIAQGAQARPAPRSVPSLGLVGSSLLAVLTMLVMLLAARDRAGRRCI